MNTFLLEDLCKIIGAHSTNTPATVKEAVVIVNCLMTFLDNRPESISKPNKREVFVKKITSLTTVQHALNMLVSILSLYASLQDQSIADAFLMTINHFVKLEILTPTDL